MLPVLCVVVVPEGFAVGEFGLPFGLAELVCVLGGVGCYSFVAHFAMR